MNKIQYLSDYDLIYEYVFCLTEENEDAIMGELVKRGLFDRAHDIFERCYQTFLEEKQKED